VLSKDTGNRLKDTGYRRKVLICYLLPLLAVFSPCLSNNPVSGSPRHKKADVSVELRDVSKSRGEVAFSHPYFITEDRLRTILASLRFREKGALKSKSSKRIFLDRELNELVPRIVESLSKADPHKEVFASITSEKTLLRDQGTTFCLFMQGRELNVVFSQVHVTKEEAPSFKGWKTAPPAEDPTSITSHGSWEVVPVGGQNLKEGHKNWLVMDVEDKAFEPVITVEEKITPSSLIEDRLRRLEERAGLPSTGKGEQGGAVSEQSAPAELPQKRTSPSDKTLGQKLRELKTLLNEGLISQKDYEKKKLDLLQEEPPQGKSVPEMLKELRGLQDEALITEGDYDRWKAKLLEKL